VLSLFSELISNNKPIIMSIEGSVYYPYIIEYTERDFGGELETTPDYKG
jgi:microcin C transport system permease protein